MGTKSIVDKMAERCRTKYKVKIYVQCIHCQGGTINQKGRRVKCSNCNGEGVHEHYMPLDRWVTMISHIKSDLIEQGHI